MTEERSVFGSFQDILIMYPTVRKLSRDDEIEGETFFVFKEQIKQQLKNS